MFGMTTKINMLKAGPILFAGLVVLIVAELLLMFLFPGDTMLMVVSAIGLVLFAAMTVHDAQQTRAIFNEYAGYGPEMIKKVSIICALNLYLDFVNIFLDVYKRQVNDGHRVGHQIRVLRAQPMNARITSEPSHLLAGQPLGLLSDVGKRLILAP